MDFMDISKMHITIRQFSQKSVEEEKIEKILEAGRWSPTAVNAQPQRVLVLNTPENLDKSQRVLFVRLRSEICGFVKRVRRQGKWENQYLLWRTACSVCVL